MVRNLDRDIHQRVDSDVEDIRSDMVGIEQSLQSFNLIQGWIN